MSILLHPDLPASRRVAAKDVAPLRIALVNLMPNKKQTETQFTRVLTGCRLSIELTLVLPDSYQPTHTAPDHLRYSYRRFSQVAGDRFDGVIVTGAPVGFKIYGDPARRSAEKCRARGTSRVSPNGLVPDR
jgi:homoserine O-succinyltransferase/O-acetyltransferase